MKEAICPNCKYGEIKVKQPIMFLLGLINCPYCKGEVAPEKNYELLFMVIAPIFAYLVMLTFLNNFSLIFYWLGSITFTAIFSFLLYKSPIRVIEHKKILEQKVLFGAARPTIIGPILIFGLGAMGW